MASATEQPQLEIQVETKNIPIDPNQSKMDGGFTGVEYFYRHYNAEMGRRKSVKEFYHNQHINQTYNFVKKMREQYGKLNRTKMSIWECCELLNEFVDEVDPDLDEPQIEHLLQTAKAIKKLRPSK